MMKTKGQAEEAEERCGNGFNFLAQIKSAGTTPRSSKTKHMEDVSILSAGSDGKRLEAAGSTPSLKKMNAGSSLLLVPNFTNLTESMSEDSSGFDMNQGANLALFRDRYPMSNTRSNESELEIQFQSDVESEEDQTWSAPFAVAARVVEKQEANKQKQQREHHQVDYLLQNRSIDEVERIWSDAEFAARAAIPQLPPSLPQQATLGSTNRPPPEVHLTCSEEQSLVEIDSSPTSQSTSSSSADEIGSNALLDDDTLAGDDYTYDDTTLEEDDSYTDGDTYGDETITLDDDADDTFAGETIVDDNTYMDGRRGSMGFLEALLDDFADVDLVGGRVGSIPFLGCGAQTGNTSPLVNENAGTYTKEITRQNPNEIERIGTWVGILNDSEAIDQAKSMTQVETLDEITTEEWSIIARLKQALWLTDDVSSAAPISKRAQQQRNNQPFLGAFFSCND